MRCLAPCAGMCAHPFHRMTGTRGDCDRQHVHGTQEERGTLDRTPQLHAHRARRGRAHHARGETARICSASTGMPVMMPSTRVTEGVMTHIFLVILDSALHPSRWIRSTIWRARRRRRTTSTTRSRPSRPPPWAPSTCWAWPSGCGPACSSPPPPRYAYLIKMANKIMRKHIDAVPTRWILHRSQSSSVPRAPVQIPVRFSPP